MRGASTQLVRHSGVARRTAAAEANAAARVAAAMSPDVLHVAYTYFPDAVGGTEIYVASLVDALWSQNVASVIAAPGEDEAAYHHDGVPGVRFATARRPRLE